MSATRSTNSYALATRYEYFDDRDGFNTGTAQHFNEFTETFERIVAKHLITRWEYRRDMSNRATSSPREAGSPITRTPLPAGWCMCST